VTECWAVGDNLNDLGLLRLADRGFAIEPRAAALRDEPGITVIRSFEELLPLVPEPPPAAAA
jgi:phosphoserine phosphatase